MFEFLAEFWEAVPGDSPTVKWPTLVAILTVVGFVLGGIGWVIRWAIKFIQKSKKPDPETAPTEAVKIAGQSTREIAKVLARKSEEAGIAKAESGALRDQLDEKDIQIAALTKAIAALQIERATAGPENQATIDDALARLAEGRTEEATALLRTIAEEKAAAGATANREAAAGALSASRRHGVPERYAGGLVGLYQSGRT